MATTSRICAVLLGCSVPALAAPAWSQTTTTATEGSGLEEVVVTAQHQVEDVQSTPLSITAFTADALEARGLTNIADLAAQAPSLSVKTDFGAANPNIYIRGVGIGDFNANVTGAVGVYVDEVYQSSPAGQLFQFYDLERVEILRGPQGTLYGRNTTGGAINVLSRQPSDEFSANASVLYGRFDETHVEFGVGGPLAGERLTARLAATVQRRDGTIRNTFTGSRTAPDRVNDVDTYATRLLVAAHPSDAMDLLLNVHYGHSDVSGVAFNHRGLLDPTAFASGTIAPCSLGQLDRGTCVDALGYAEGDTNPDTVQYNDPSRELVKAWGANLKASAALGRHAFTSITAYENVSRDSVFDGDESPLSLLNAKHRPKSHQFTQELRFASPTDERFHWLTGAYYFEEDLQFHGAFDLFRQMRPAIAAAATTLGLGFPLSTGFNPTGGPALAAALGNPVFAYPTLASVYDYDQRVESRAVFGQVYYDLTSTLTATLGLRYSDEERTFDYASALVEPALTIPLVETSAALGNDTTSFSDLSWRAALEWQASKALFAFVSISRGSKSGGFNGAFMLTQGQATPFEDEQLTAYEVGLKSEWLANSLRLNLTGFYYDYTDLQTYTLQSTGGIPQQVLANAPAAKVSGIELELLARPIDPLLISIGASVLDSELTATFIGGNGADLRGNELGYAPHFTSNGSATYTFDLPSSAALAFAADYSYQARSYTDTRNLPNLRTGDGLIAGARVSYLSSDGHWEASLWGRNLTDQRYISYVADLGDFGFNRVKYSEPRTFGVSFRLKY